MVSGGDPDTIIVKVLSGGSSYATFIHGENIKVGSTTVAKIQDSGTLGKCMTFTIQSGLLYLNNNFVYYDKQTIAVDKYSNTSSKKIGFIVNESIITSDEDSTLLDNAQGTYNYAAPGADRYKIDLVLAAKELSDTSLNFTEINRVDAGELVKKSITSTYSILGEELARRTMDESGNYTVREWPIQISNSTETTPNADNFTAALDPGKGYIKGFEFSTDNQRFLHIPRARRAKEIRSITSSDVNATYGNYVNVSNVKDKFDSTALVEVDLHNVLKDNAVSTSKIGTAKVRFFRYSGTGTIGVKTGATRAIYRMYLFSVTMNSGKFFRDVKSILIGTTAGATGASSANIDILSKEGGVDSTSITVSSGLTSGTTYIITSVGTTTDWNAAAGTSAVTYTVGSMFTAVSNYSTGNGTVITKGGSTYLSGSDSPELVFRVSNQYVESVTRTNYQIQRTYARTFSGGGTNTVSIDTVAITNGYERFIGTAGANQNDDSTIKPNYHMVITTLNNAGSTGFVVGDIIPFNSGSGRTLALSSPATEATIQTATFNINDSSFQAVVSIIATLNVNNKQARIKTLSAYQKLTIAQAAINKTLGSRDSIAASDIQKGSVRIWASSSSPTGVGTDGTITGGGTVTEVTSSYTVDDGQRAELYDHGSIILKGTATSANFLTIAYKNFSESSATGYLSKNSYNSIPYGSIPTFIDPATNITYNLRDCIDFRPRRQDGATTLQYTEALNPLGTFGLDYNYYLGRVDKIIVSQDGRFVWKEGVPDAYPVAPSDDVSGGMTIYALVVPPYTSDVGDISIKYVDNKRYTMRDIGKLDKRIQNLEYYTQLSLLEKQAKDQSIVDNSNPLSAFEKFKNGFVVDPFTTQDIFVQTSGTWANRRWSWWTSWFNGSNTWSNGNVNNTNYNTNSIADITNSDFTAAIDPVAQEMRAPFTISFLGFNAPTLTNTAVDPNLTYVKKGDYITLPYTETTAIDQPKASGWMNINPFNVIKYNGTMILNPPFDQWVDTVNLPAVNRVVDTFVPDAADKTVKVIVEGGNGGDRIWRTTSSTTSFDTNVVGSSTQSLGSNVVDVQYVPYIRQSTVIGRVTGLKPNVRVYPFIELTRIDSSVKPLPMVTITPTNNTNPTFISATPGNYENVTFKNSGGTAVATADVAFYSAPIAANAAQRYIWVFNVTGTIPTSGTVVRTSATSTSIATINALTYGSSTGGTALTPNEFGTLLYQFDIPANTYKTGERTIRLSDIESTETNFADLAESLAAATYTATGITQYKQEEILTTRALQKQKVTTETGYWYDPLAQSFMIDSRAYPQGMHITSIDAYFKTKSTSGVPVTMEIRRMTDSGVPEFTRSLPLAEVTLNPEQVSLPATTLDNATPVATTFTFPTPIYLPPGDFAIVLWSNTQDYNVFTAETGSFSVTDGALIDKQPYMGSLFKSQNGSTWTPVQEQDLMFKIKRAVFSASSQAVFEINPTSLTDYQTVFINAAMIAPPKTSISWEARAISSTGTLGSYTPINVNRDIDYLELKKIAAKSGNDASLTIRATLTTENTQVSPVIDSAALSCVVAKNTINDIDAITGETSKIGGTALARYITKSINLASGFESNNICVTLNAYKPAGTSIKVYYKTLASEKTTPISDESWVEMTLQTSVSNSSSIFDYKEHRFFPVGAYNAYGVSQANPISPAFNAFQIKVVLTSNSIALTPKVRDFRAIALDS